jgi:hypothetical protein
MVDSNRKVNCTQSDIKKEGQNIIEHLQKV